MCYTHNSMKRTGTLSKIVSDIWSGRVGIPKSSADGWHSISRKLIEDNPQLWPVILQGEYIAGTIEEGIAVRIGSEADLLVTDIGVREVTVSSITSALASLNRSTNSISLGQYVGNGNFLDPMKGVQPISGQTFEAQMQTYKIGES